MTATLRPDPTFHPSPRLAMEAEAEHICYTALLSPDRSRPDALAVVDVDPAVGELRQGAQAGRPAEQRRRVAPLRLERLQFGAVAADRPCLPAAALPGGAGHALLAHLHLRHPARSAPAQAHQDDRAGGDPAQDRLLAPAHRALRPGRHLRQHPGRRRRRTAPRARRASSSWTARPSRCWALGDRPRAAEAALRLLVEPAARLHGVQRMGRCRRSSRTASSPRTCWPTSTAMRCTSGTCASASTCRPSTWAPTTRWRWRSARRTTRRANTASSAWWSTPPTWRRRSGPGTARTASSTARKTITIPPEPAEADDAAAAAEGLRRRAAAGQRHRPVAGRPPPLRRVLGHRRTAPVRRQRPDGARS